MADTTKGTLQLLEELRAERDELELLIKALEKRLGIIAGPKHGEAASSDSKPKINVSLDSIPVGFFHNMTLAAAAEKLLRTTNGNPLGTGEILAAFRKSGVVIASKNAVTILYTALKRSPKFERVAGKMWGLAEWYPDKRRRKEPESESESSEEE